MQTDPTPLLDRLEAVAKKATPGPWEPANGRQRVMAVDHGGMRVGMYPHIATVARGDDADYLSALAPEVLLALVEVARALNDLCDGMGVELDDDRISYISVQLDREDVKAARAALSRLAALGQADGR